MVNPRTAILPVISSNSSNNSISLKKCQFCNYRPNMKKEKRKCEECDLNHGRVKSWYISAFHA